MANDTFETNGVDALLAVIEERMNACPLNADDSIATTGNEDAEHSAGRDESAMPRDFEHRTGNNDVWSYCTIA